jgi:cytoskeleton protein RodZ
VFELGTSLREARTRRRIELGQAEQATKIRGKYLRALEEEQFDTLPSPTYVKGYLRTYADYLGLDGQLYVDEYASRFVSGADWEGRRARRSAAQNDARGLQTWIVVAAVALIALVTVVVIAAWKTSGTGSAVDKTAHKATAPRKKVAPAVPAPTAYLEITAVRGPSQVTVNRSQSGRHVLFEGTLERGETEAFTGKRFWLNVGAPENLVIRVGGRRVHVVGGRPWVLTVTPNGWHGHPA